MSKEFIQEKVGATSLAEAVRQQEQILHFIKSKVQPEQYGDDYIQSWANGKFKTDDHFLSWVKTIFKHDNFVQFFNYLRYPLPSARLINNKIKVDLERVFFSEDAYFKYTIGGETVEAPEELDTEAFDKMIFKALIYRFNDILVTDLSDVNVPVRHIIPIDRVVAISSSDNTIHQIAYGAAILVENEPTDGYLYLDNKAYIFYDKDFKNDPIEFPHDLGVCPADYIAAEGFSDDITREGIFSYVKEELEEYVFLKTIQRMSEPNGVIPVTTSPDFVEADSKDDKWKGGSSGDSEMLMSPDVLYPGLSQKMKVEKPITQAGTDIKAPVMRKADGTVDMELIKNYLNFFYIPTECLEFLESRIIKLETSIVATITGDYNEQSEDAKNELQVERSYLGKQDKLRGISQQLTRIRNLSDWKFLALKHGGDRVQVDAFYGSDFFIETQGQLFKLFKDAPNPIERKTILVRLAQNRGRFNKSRAERDVILYKLMPYSTDIEFTQAMSLSLVGPNTQEFQMRFNFWLSLFESKYGDILGFWNLFEIDENQKLILINNLIIQLIKENHEQPIERPIEEKE